MDDFKETGQMIGQGNTAEIYDFGDGFVLKLYRDGLPNQLCREEFCSTQIAYDATRKAPKPVKIGCYQGRIGGVYEKLSGKTMLKNMLARPWKAAGYAEQLAACHVSIQNPVVDDMPTVKEKLKADMERVDLLSQEEKQQIYEYIDSLPNGNTLCHFDFHPDNIILSENGYRVIDWMTACTGDKLSDVARTGIILKFSQIPRIPAIVNYFVGMFQRRVHKNYLHSYLAFTKEAMGDIEKWELPVAAARLSEWIPNKEKQTLLAFVHRKLVELK